MSHAGRHRILLMRLSSLGDLVLCTPCIDVLRRSLPESHITMLTDSRFADLFTHDPEVDALLLFDRNRRETISIARQLKGKFDITIDLHHKFRTAFWGIASRAAIRIGYAGRFGWLYTDKMAIDDESHWAESHVRLLSFLGIDVDEIPDVHLPIPPEMATWAEEEMLARGIGQSRYRFCVFPGSGWESKRWRVERFAAVADLATEKLGAQILIFAGPSEESIAAQMADIMAYKSHLFGQLSIGQLAALLSRCDLFLSSDTGPMHIAAAVGLKTIGLFGPMSAVRYAPYSRKSCAIESPAQCAPCGELRKCNGRTCMDAITIDMVWQKVKQICSIDSTGYS